MATFAKINENGLVLAVHAVNNKDICDENGNENEEKGINFLINCHGWLLWKQTSYNTRGGIHIKEGTPFRKNYAGIGYTYDKNRDAFIPPKTSNSWILNENTCLWEPPIPMPNTETDGQKDFYYWKEDNNSWVKL